MGPRRRLSAKRQGKGPKKARFEMVLATDLYDRIYQIAQANDISMAEVVNRAIRRHLAEQCST